MPNYQNGKIYKIENDKNDLIYYGSTTQPLCKRMVEHRGKHSKCMSKKLEVDLRECRIVLIENFPCNNKDELNAREAYYIRNFPCVNKVIPGRTHEEYREEHREQTNKRMKEYNKANKDKIAEKNKERYQKNRQKLLEQKKEYSEKNKEKIKEKGKKYYQANKEKILKQRKEYYQRTKNHSSSKE